MPKGLTQTSDVVSVSFSLDETAPNTFNQLQVSLQLSPLDQEVFVVTAVSLDPYYPDAIAATDTRVNASVTTTTQTAVQNLSNSQCLATAANALQAAGFVDGGVSFQTIALESPQGTTEYIGIISTNDFFVQVKGVDNGASKGVDGRLWGYRAKASSSIYAALVNSELLSSN
jgi:hypothetical protein